MPPPPELPVPLRLEIGVGVRCDRHLVAAGVNVTLMWQVASGSKVAGQSLVCEKSPASLPVKLIAIPTATGPTFVAVTVCGALEPPTGDEKLSEAGLIWIKPAGREVLMWLLEDADVLVENFKPGSMESASRQRGSHLTLRWREMDSNPQYRAIKRKVCSERKRFQLATVENVGPRKSLFSGSRDSDQLSDSALLAGRCRHRCS